MDQLKLAGRYEITRELGRGGMGIVYLARDPVLDRMVAIKTLRPQKLDAESQTRFDREARAIAKMDHPGHRPDLRPAARLHLVGTYALGEMENDHPLHGLLKRWPESHA